MLNLIKGLFRGKDSDPNKNRAKLERKIIKFIERSDVGRTLPEIVDKFGYDASLYIDEIIESTDRKFIELDNGSYILRELFNDSYISKEHANYLDAMATHINSKYAKLPYLEHDPNQIEETKEIKDKAEAYIQKADGHADNIVKLGGRLPYDKEAELWANCARYLENNIATMRTMNRNTFSDYDATMQSALNAYKKCVRSVATINSIKKFL